MRFGCARIGLFLCLFAIPVFACWQTEQPPVVISAKSLNVRITNNDKPQVRMKFELHKAITFDREEARSKGLYNKSILKSVSSDSLGMLTFGGVSPGRYWMVAGNESIAVEVIAPTINSPFQRLWVKYFADSCRDVTVESAS